jgi:hypothetical protein
LKKTIPHFYDSIYRNSIKEAGNKTNGFNKYPRFAALKKKFEEIRDTPSSQTYDTINYKSITEKARKAISHSRNNDLYAKLSDRFDNR